MEGFRDVSCGARLPIDVRWLARSNLFTHEWHSAVCTPADLRLVCVDEDTRMSQRSSTTIARDNLRLRPSYRLFVDQVNGGHWTWLLRTQLSLSCVVDCSHLIFHDRLLKTGTNHCLCSRLLASRPRSSTIWRLHVLHLQTLLDRFLQCFVSASARMHWQCIRARH